MPAAVSLFLTHSSFDSLFSGLGKTNHTVRCSIGNPNKVSMSILHLVCGALCVSARYRFTGYVSGIAHHIPAMRKCESVQEGQLVMAKVQRCGGAGLVASLPDGTRGVVALTDLHDKFVANALEHLMPNMIVRARITEVILSETHPGDEARAAAQTVGNELKGGRKGQGRGKKMETSQVALRGLTLRQSCDCVHSGALCLSALVP